MSVELFLKVSPFKNQAELKFFIDTLHKAGLQERA
jgi:hypothetical protein